MTNDASRVTIRIALALVALGCSRPAVTTAPPNVPARRAAVFPAGWRFDAGRRAISAETAMVASDEMQASRAGIEMLRRGGNAIDAAVAVGFALAVTYQEAGNLGGGGFMVIRMADGRTAALDYREMAPRAAHRDMYVDASGKVTDASVDGWLASGVPGAVRGMTEAHRRYGTLPLADVIAPAIRLAAEGFTVTEEWAKQVRDDSARIARYGGRGYLPSGRVPAVGSRFRQPALARTLRLIAERGADAFYKGEIADSIAAEMRRGGGNITKADLEGYRAHWRRPVVLGYRGYSLISMPPSSSGGTTIGQTLKILETYPSMPAFGTAAYAHLLASAYQRAFIDRNRRLGDPDFVRVPVGLLVSEAYAKRVAATIRRDRATATHALDTAMAAAADASGGTETTHYSVVDRFGNAVATTTTVNSLFGSGVLLNSVGFFMNNEMDDFAARPGTPNQFGLVQGEANAVAPRKRPLSAMSPTIVVDSSGALLLVVGARGGPRIISATSQIILNVIDHRMSIADAMAAPRIHHQALPDTMRFEREGLSAETRRELERMGWAVAPIGSIALANAIMRVRGGYRAVPDPRRPGGVAGY